MANKPIPDPWPLIPPYWQAEVPRLLSSKADFLGGRKRSSAAVAELATLYAQLETAWDELTSKQSKRNLEILRQRAIRLQQTLKRDETDVMSELEQQSAHELRNVEKHLQRRSESLQQRRQLLAERKTSWPTELAQMRTDCANSLRTLRGELAEQKAQLKTSLATEWQRFETNEAGDELSLADLTGKQQQLQAQQNNLAQLQQSLSSRKASLPVMQQQLDADLSAQQQTSENTSSLRQSWKSKRQRYTELKSKLLSLGLIGPDDFPDL